MNPVLASVLPVVEASGDVRLDESRLADVASWLAYDRNRNSQPTARNIFLAIAALALAGMLFPLLLWQRLVYWS